MTLIARNMNIIFSPLIQSKSTWIVLFLLLSLPRLEAQKTISKAQWNALDQAMVKAMEEMNLPSISVAVVSGNQTWVKSHGVLNSTQSALANGSTLYAVASNTKAFTSAALAQLVDAQKIQWDDRVQTYLPGFELYDPYVSSDLRIRDLLCHRSGLATFSGDLLWYGTDWSADDVLEKAAKLKPTSSFRTQFGYQNILYIAAGKIIETVTGVTWEQYVQDSLISQLEMSRSILSTRFISQTDNVAQPHNELEDGELTPIDWLNWDNMAPAGALITSVEDMARWMRVQLDSGRVENGRLWNPQRTREMWTMHTPIPVSSWYEKHLPSVHFRGYGLGWELATLHGYKIVAHSGGYDGMISRQVLVPELELGIFIVTNTNSSVPWALGYDALDLLIQQSKSTHLLDFLIEERAKEPEQKAQEQAELEASRILDTSPSHSLESYAGTYVDEIYGAIEVTIDQGELHIDFLPTALFKGRLEHWHFDTFQLHWKTQMMLPSGTAHFSLNSKGQVHALDIAVTNPDFIFEEFHFIRKTEEF